MVTTPISQLVQLPSLDELVELYDLDATNISGGGVYHFTPMALTGAPATAVVWGGVTYAPVPVVTTGWTQSGSGTQPAPQIKVANVNLAFSALAIALNDLLGATLTRHRTFRRYLDGQSDADPTVELSRDIYKINQKMSMNKIFIEWQLAPAIDQEGRQLPGRQVLQGACNFRYRVWNGTAFDYTHTTCPYVGTNYFDAFGNSVATPDLDVPGKRVDNCCKTRFPGVALPFGGFPGVARS